MKLSAVVEYDENIVMVPLVWLSREDRQYFIQIEYEVIPIPGYRETNGYRAVKIIGKYGNNWLICNFSIPIWEDWKLTAGYAARAERKVNSTTGQQMFDCLDDDEKIQALKYDWWDPTPEYIIKYFEDHPDLLKRARHSLTPKDIVLKFKKKMGRHLNKNS